MHACLVCVDDREFITIRNHSTGEPEEVLNPNFAGLWEAPLIRNPASEHDRLPTAEVRVAVCVYVCMYVRICTYMCLPLRTEPHGNT